MDKLGKLSRGALRWSHPTIRRHPKQRVESEEKEFILWLAKPKHDKTGSGHIFAIHGLSELARKSCSKSLSPSSICIAMHFNELPNGITVGHEVYVQTLIWNTIDESVHSYVLLHISKWFCPLLNEECFLRCFSEYFGVETEAGLTGASCYHQREYWANLGRAIVSFSLKIVSTIFISRIQICLNNSDRQQMNAKERAVVWEWPRVWDE